MQTVSVKRSALAAFYIPIYGTTTDAFPRFAFLFIVEENQGYFGHISYELSPFLLALS